MLVPCLIGLSACDNNVNTKTVTKEQWNEAMSFDYDNYAINFTYTDYSGENTIKVKKDGENYYYYYYEVDFDSSVEEEYFRKYGDMYLTYSLNSDQSWSVLEDKDGEYYNSIAKATCRMLQMFDYDAFSYNETNESHEAEKIAGISYNGYYISLIECKDCSLSFENGKLKTLKYTEIKSSSDNITYTYTFSYDNTTIVFPQQIKV